MLIILTVIWTHHKPESPVQTPADTNHRQRQLEHKFARILFYQWTFHPCGKSNSFHMLLITVLPPERHKVIFFNPVTLMVCDVTTCLRVTELRRQCTSYMAPTQL